MQKSQSETFTVIGLLAVLVAAASLAVYFPQNRKLDQIKTRIAAEKVAMDEQAQKIAVIPQMQREVQELRSRYRNFDRRLPKQKELGEFLRQISGNLTEARLSNQLIEPGKPEKEELFHTLPIIMKFDGSFPAVADFIKHIERMERLTRVQKLVIMTDKRTDQLNIELQMNIYFTES